MIYRFFRAIVVAGYLVATTVVMPFAARADVAPAPMSICELHVWGVGYPNRPPVKPRSNAFVRFVTPAVTDPNDPNALGNLLDTAKRGAAFSDETLKKLFPDAVSVTIIKHKDVIDLDLHPIDKLSVPLAATKEACYADLIVANIYALYMPAKRDASGNLVGELIDGGSRVVLDLRFLRYGSPGGKSIAIRRRNDGPLGNVDQNSPDLAVAYIRASDKVLEEFVPLVVKKSPVPFNNGATGAK